MKRSISLAAAPFLFSLLLSGCGDVSGVDPEEAICGNDVVEDGEGCDDGNDNDGDGCSAECEEEEISENPVCGDGVLEPGEQCLADQESEIDEYVRSLELVPTEEESETVNSTSPAQVSEDGIYSCSAENLTQVVSLSSLSILSDGTSTLFPGALLRGDSLYTGQFAEIAFARKPMTYSLSIQDGSSAPRSATMQDPSLSEFRNTIGGILEQAQLDQATISAQSTVREVRSEQELELAVGFDLDTATFDLASKFDFNSQTTRSHFLVTVDATFFTADVDAIANPSDVLAASVPLSEVQQKLNDQNPPVYVSTVTYGTRFYIAVESSFSSEEVNAALSAAFNGVAVDADGEVTLSTRDIIEESSFDFIAVGASQQQLALLNAALNASDRFAALSNFATNPLVFSAENIGAPLTFTMKHLADNSLAAIAFRGTFDALTCDRISQNILVTLKQILVAGAADGEAGANDSIELYGTIRAQGLTSGNIFSFPDNQFVTLFNDDPFDATGAQFQKVVRINPQQATAQVQLFANLFEDDGNNGDDTLPPGVLTINKNSDGGVDDAGQLLGRGFNGVYEIFIPSDNGDFTIIVELKPVP